MDTSSSRPEQHGARLRWSSLPKNVLHDQVAIWTSPRHIDRNNGKWWLLFGGATAGLIPADKYLSGTGGNSKAENTVSTWASRIGAAYTIYPLTFVFYAAGRLSDSPRSRDAGRIGVEAMADVEITVNLVKLMSQRERPWEGNGNGHFWSGGDSFPSGHSARSWALATVIATEFQNRRWVPPLAYGLAATVSVARVSGHQHWPSDALAGSALGYFIGRYVYSKHHARGTHSGAVGWLASHVNLGCTGYQAGVLDGRRMGQVAFSIY